MALSLQDFITKYTGKFIDFDGAYGAQCVDLMNQYCVDVLGISAPISILPGDSAYDIYQNYSGAQFTKTKNTPTGVPKPGDIVFWDLSVGPAGHVDIFISGDENNFQGFDQNWPVGSPCHEQSHTYSGVTGWLSFVETPPPPDATTTDPSTDLAACLAQHAVLVDQANQKDAEIAALKTTQDNLNQTINDRNNDITQLNATVSTLKTQLVACQQSIDSLTPVAKQVPDLKKQLQDNIDKVSGLSGEITSLNRTISQLKSQQGNPKTFWEKIKYLFG